MSIKWDYYSKQNRSDELEWFRVPAGACWATGNWHPKGVMVKDVSTMVANTETVIFYPVVEPLRHTTSYSLFSSHKNYNEIIHDLENWGPQTMQTFADIIKFFSAEEYIWATPGKIFIQMKPKDTWRRGEFLAWGSLLRAYQEHPVFFVAMQYLRTKYPEVPLTHAVYLSLSATDGGHISRSINLKNSYFRDGIPKSKGCSNIFEALTGDGEYVCGVSSWGNASANTVPMAYLTNCWVMKGRDFSKKIDGFYLAGYEALCKAIYVR
jgi:hypothetical protein